MRRLNNKGMAPIAIVVIIAVAVFMLLLLPAILFAGEQGYNTEGGNCTGGEGSYQYPNVKVTRYGPDCPGCSGYLKGKTDYFQKKINGKTVKYKKVNVKPTSSDYGPDQWPDVFREVTKDQILKPNNTTPALIEFNDDDYGWVKIVAMQESNTGVKPAQGYESGSVLKVTLPGNKLTPFLVIIGDTGNLAGSADFKAKGEDSTTLDLLTMKNDVTWFNQVFSPDYNTEGGNVTVDVLRIGYDGEASDNMNCTDASGNFVGDVDQVNGKQPSIAAYMKTFGSTSAQVKSQLVNVTFHFGVNSKTVKIHKLACSRFMSAIADANILRGSDSYKIKSIGTYAWRGIVSKGGTCTVANCSRHSFGVAFDINAYSPNGYGPNAKSDIPKWMIQAFAKYGIYWGGNWSPTYYDPMHFQVNNLAPYQGPECK